MTLAVQTGTGTTVTTSLNLPDFTEGPFSANVLATIGQLIDLDLPNVRDEVEKWLNWMLIGGHRPKAQRWVVNVRGTNAIRTTQDLVCAALEPYYAGFDLDNDVHFTLLERATRPLPKTAL